MTRFVLWGFELILLRNRTVDTVTETNFLSWKIGNSTRWCTYTNVWNLISCRWRVYGSKIIFSSVAQPRFSWPCSPLWRPWWHRGRWRCWRWRLRGWRGRWWRLEARTPSPPEAAWIQRRHQWAGRTSTWSRVVIPKEP